MRPLRFWGCAGGILVFAGVLAGGCGDEEKTTAPSAGTQIGPAGGRAVSVDERASLSVPAGALSGTITVTIDPKTSPPDPMWIVGTAYEFSPSDAQFSVPCTVSISYSAAQIPSKLDETDLRIVQHDGVGWVDLDGSTVDFLANRVHGTTTHFSPFAVAVPPWYIVGTSIVINDDSTCTASTTVALRVEATGASLMMLANSSDFTGASWEVFSTARTGWRILPEDGPKVVWVQFANDSVSAVGKTSDTIVLDQTPPSLPSNPRPVDGAEGAPLSMNLMWSPSAETRCPSVTYDVFLDAGSPPTTHVGSTEDTSFAVDGLIPGQPYSWTVVATDGVGNTAEGENETWTFTASRWDLLHDGAGTAPSTRSHHAALYEPLGARMVVFGGYRAGTRLGDTWAFDPSGGTWTLMNGGGSGAPAAREGHAVAYDTPEARMIVFGGLSGVPFNDTWAFDVGAARWENLHDGEGTAPEARTEHSAVYDVDGERVVVFGGWSAGPPLETFNDVWAFDLTSDQWAQLHDGSGTAPAARGEHTAIYDPAAGRIVVFGGRLRTKQDLVHDTWAFDLSSRTWEILDDGAGTAPSARRGHSAVYEPAGHRMIVFGGYGGETGTWGFDLTTHLWEKLDDGVWTAPSRRHQHAAVYDVSGERMILFGGWTLVGTSAGEPVNDTWAFYP